VTTPLENISRLLIRSPNWLGDAIMSLPALQRLQAAGYRLSVLCPPKLNAFWTRVTDVEDILPADENPAITASALRPHHFDAAIIYPNSLRTGLEIWLAGIPIRIGYSGHSRRWLLTHPVEKTSRQQWRHHAYHYLDLIETSHLTTEDSRLSLRPLPQPDPPTSMRGSYLAVCPGAEYGPAKRWPPERFAEAANQIARKQTLEIVLLGSSGDRPACEAVASHLPRARNLSGRTSLGEFMAWIAHASVVLCNDSGAMHIAAAYDRPGVAIFGSTEPAWTGPLRPSIQPVRHHVPCSPCFLRECPIDFRCMTAVTTAKVVKAAISRIN